MEKEIIQPIAKEVLKSELIGDDYEIVPVLVLTKARDLFTDATVSGTDASVQVCSGDMLYNALDFWLGFIR